MKKMILSTLLICLLACPSFAALAKVLAAAGVVINSTQGLAAQQYPNIIADGAGNTIVGWHDSKSGAVALYAQKFNSSGVAQWSPSAGVPICTVTNYFGTMMALDSNALAFQMVSDGSGGAILAWNDYRSDGTTSHVYAQRINSSGAVVWTANGKVVCDATNGQSLNSMIADGSGGAILAWTDARNMVSGQDIYVQKIAGADGASQWTTNGVQIVDNTVIVAGANRPVLCSNGGGGAIIAWDDNRANASYYGVYAQEVGSNGGVVWAANGVAVQVNAAGSAVNPKIVADSLGGAVIAWWDERVNPGGSQFDVFAQRVDTNGDKVFTTQGVTLCLQSDYSDNSVNLDIVTDGANGAIVSWPDMRNVGGGYRIYAQKVVANGGVSWTADGVLVNTVLNNTSDSRPRMVADGSGGAYITTAFYGSGGTQDIRVHRIASADGSDVVGWADGKAVNSTATVDERNPRIAYDTINGQVVVVWMNQANDTYGDIWGQALSSGGAYGWGTTTGKELIATTGAATQRYSVVTGHPTDGGGVAVWEDNRSVDYYQIYSQRFNSSGAVLWSADGVRLDATSEDNLRPSICRTSDGYYIVAWTNGSTIYMQKLNSDGAAQWAAGGVAVASTFGSGFYYPVVASDGAGGAIVAYSVGAPGAVIGTSLRFTGKLWASAFVSDLSDEYLPDLNGLLLAKNGGGGGGPGTFRLYYKRIASNGSVVTPYGGDAQDATTLGVLATTYHDAVNGEIQLWPSIAKVDSTNFAIVWDDRRTIDGSAYWSIRAQKGTISDGSRQWTDDAVAVVTPGGTSVTYYPCIGRNGTDGAAVVAWMQSDTSGAGHNYDIKANKLTSSGTLSWSTGINVANSGSLDEIRPKVAVDSSGSSFFVWQEGTWSGDAVDATTQHPTATMSNGAIYSQLVDSSGTLSGTKFQVSGVANVNYEAPDVASSSTAGTDIVVWDADVFAQMVSGVGVAPTAPTGFSGTAQSSSSILWSWTDNANNETGFKVLNASNNSIVATIATANTASYSETGLSPNTAYRRTVTAYETNAGNSSTPTAVTVYTLASIPDEMTATAAETSLAITWAVGDGTTYKLERAPASSGPWTTLSSTLTSKSYSDTGLTAGTTYWYKCSAANADGVWSAASEQYSFTTSTTTGVTRQAPTIGKTKSSGTGFAIASNDYITSAGDLKLSVSDLNTDGRITSVVVQFLNSSGVEVRRIESSEVLSVYSLPANQQLSPGTYTVLITATSVYGTTSVKELTGLVVAENLSVTKALVAYPTAVLQSSIRAQDHTAVQMAYQLSKNGNVSMVIYNTAGQVIYRGDYAAGTNGGSAGPNAVSWSGYTVAGAPAARGLYIVQLIDRDSKRLLGKVAVPIH